MQPWLLTLLAFGPQLANVRPLKILAPRAHVSYRRAAQIRSITMLADRSNVSRWSHVHDCGLPAPVRSCSSGFPWSAISPAPVYMRRPGQPAVLPAAGDRETQFCL
ncbi:hypothetical protein B0J12DRAFT_17684 [Macrophomina phaseolina]|uniref:Secreted protein n=1 Tax=Macrophomina phaseolina TaxID=35725 RepID=A0ABQ8GX35_9PEZI|nr:hypothetical protein B0J12DRAFT_17684 [Macrophomina phaseolina]